MYGAREEAPDFGNHSALVAAIARFLAPQLYVELGIEHATTLIAVLPYCVRAIAVDIYDRSAECAGFPTATFIQADSRDFLPTLNDDAIDLCFLDSSHEFAATVQEFAWLDRKVRPNGVVLFHDAYPPNSEFAQPGNCGRVCEAVAKLKVDYASRWEFVTLPAQFGLTIARKNLGKQLLWL